MSFPPTSGFGNSARQAVTEVRDELNDGYPVLGHRVPLPYRDRFVVERVEVDGHAVRRPDLVVAAVAPADGPGLVVVGLEDGPQGPGHVAGDRGQPPVPGQREHGGLDRGE